jgi:HAD superfamily hydrolase (TIGR01509 family)
LFDFDGVLADTEPVHWETWRGIVEPLGVPLSWEYYKANCVGVADAVLFTEIFKLGGANLAAAAIERRRIAFLAMVAAKPPFLPETLALVRDLALRYPLAVVSSSARPEVEPLLARAGIRDCFRVLITCEDVERIKPAPEPYLKAARLLGSRRPLVIEDSDLGVASAAAAGFDLLRIANPAVLASQLRLRLAK